MKMKNFKTLSILLLIEILVASYASADIWQRYINSNRGDQIVCKDQEVWVKPYHGGLVRWDISTGKYKRFYDTHGLQSSEIGGMTYDGEGRFVCISLGEILVYEDGSFNVLCEAPKDASPDNFTCIDGRLLVSYGQYNFSELYIMEDDKWNLIEDFSFLSVLRIAEDPRGGFWASIVEKDEENEDYIPSIVYFNDGIKKKFYNDEISNEHIKMLYVDQNGIVWGILDFRGITWYDGEKWTCFYWDGITEHMMNNMVMDNESIIWL